ncbi:sugar ABC transporter ATP-binding protein [Agromyces intestinalis]|uniref:Sugar ABC transporter ATP-binding protein n=2 Tax=Agromyces intestinalis TaxID=2592652 RepID=A0A5C1YN38_9MICO|nr:sugar ABC transporter ATP-binding protein [Agromyces intestinalis]QEO16262.1 sugar ABC transporter ATP-binding protein [Agromyces intestinalis]
MTATDVPPVIEMMSITVAFPGVLALDGVDLRLYPGEVHAIMGENGAGKSTLIKALTGATPVESGEIRVDGIPRRLANASESRAVGIEPVYQEEYLVRNLSVLENVMLGHEARGRLGIDWRRTRAQARSMLAELGLEDLDPKLKLAYLTPAVRQLVAIARAMVAHPRVLVLDEPTSSLDAREADRLFAVVRRLRDRGVAIVFVSHFLEQVYAISDRMTVLRNGRRVGEYLTRELDRADLISKMMGKDIVGLRAITSQRKAHSHDPEGPVVYRAVSLGRRGDLEKTDIELHRGEIVGLAGLRGSGRTELASLMSGAQRPDSGSLFLNERPTSIPTPGSGIRQRIAMSSENRRDGGIIGELSMRENLVLALQALRGWARPLTKAERDDLVEWCIDAFRIHTPRPDIPVKYLSGGAQQKVLLARWLATRPKVLILDEPTRGIDIAAKVDIQARIAQLAADGVAVLFISSELEEVVRLSDRIIVLKDREKIGELSNGPGVTADSIVEMIAADHDASE